MKNIYEILEFNKILPKISEYANLDDAKSMILSLKMIADKDLLNKAIDEVDAAFSYLRSGEGPHIKNIKNIDESIIRLQKSATLSQKELLNISFLLSIAEDLIKYQKSKSIPSVIDTYFDALDPLIDINRQIKRIIISENEISDNASSILQEIRRKKRILEEKLHTTSNRLLSTYSNFLQDQVLAYKDNAICLPVKSEYKNKVDGTIHSISESQFTIFIEPKEIISVNNEIAENEAREELEISKILYELSLSLIPYTDILKANYKNILKLDFIFAKASYAYSTKSSRPILDEDGTINLVDARHPLINASVMVPLNISLGLDFDILIITGPNTGGKTVSLKTVGIIELMALSGLFIPAKENSKVAMYDKIFADIGDEQSIEQSLSTFSSHMTNIVSIINNSTPRSLILLDEICTGTDPIEGANLAISILEYLQNKGTHVIATTHYPELKHFALTKENVKNGAFEFDVETLKPTYKLLIGIPGKSNAFQISEKLGLSNKIIENAKSLVDTNDIKFEDLVASLEENRLTIEKEKETIDKYKAEIESLRDKVKRQEKGLNERANSIIRQAKEKAHDILYDAKKVADETIKSIKANDGDMTYAISERTKLTHALNLSSESLIEKVKGPARPLSAKKIKLGANVKVLSLNAEGIVESLPDKDYNLFVRIGILRTQVNLRDLELIESHDIKVDGVNIKRTYNKSGSSKIKYEKSHTVGSEINLIGKTTDEAIIELDKYIDDAYIAHIPEVRIIHGRGTGALKKTINEFCRKSKVIKEYRSGNFDEGGDGVTLAKLVDQ